MSQVRYNPPFNVPVDGKEYMSFKKRLTARDILDLTHSPEDAKVHIVLATGESRPMDEREEINMVRLNTEWLSLKIVKKKKAKPKRKSLKNYPGKFNKAGYPVIADLRAYWNDSSITAADRDVAWDEYTKTAKKSKS